MFCHQVVDWLQAAVVASWAVNVFLAACVVILVRELRREMAKGPRHV